MFRWSRATLGTVMNGGVENGFMRTTRVPYRVLYALLFTLIVVIMVVLMPSGLRQVVRVEELVVVEEDLSLYNYNNTYPLTTPIRESTAS